MTYRSSARRRAAAQPAGTLSLFDDEELGLPPRPAPQPPARPAPQPSPFPATAARRTPAQLAAANLAAIRTLRDVQATRTPATPAQRAALAGYAGWGGCPDVFAAAPPPWAARARAALASLLDEDEIAAAARSTLNAHYTDPAVAAVMWDLAAALGFAGGNALEAGCGPGLFISTAPPAADMTGVEVDPVTAGIAAALHPHAQIRCESFAQTDLPAGLFDLVIGNVPFGDYGMSGADPLCPADSRHNIHSHTLIKALRLLRPGGILVALTSRHTLDARDTDARDDMGALADLIGAARLPAGSHQDAAGTKVVMDLVVMRRREDGRAGAGGLLFADTVTRQVDGELFDMSPVFAPGGGGHVLGRLAAGMTGHGPALTVTPAAGNLAAQLAAAAASIAAAAAAAGLGWAPRGTPPPPVPEQADRTLAEGHITVRLGGTFTQVAGGRHVPFPVAAGRRAELAALCGLRDAAAGLVDAEKVLDTDDPRLDGMRGRLGALYDAYTAAWGPLNRFTRTPTGRVDPITLEPVMAHKRPPQGGFHGTGTTLPDPLATLVYALEIFDPETQSAAKAPIFTRRVVSRRTPPVTAASADDALAISLDVHGRVDLDAIAALLRATPGDARRQLGRRVFTDPAAGVLVPAAEYLSGNVRAKLADAIIAACEDPAYDVNVKALQHVLPPDIPAGDIAVQLGAPWITAAQVQEFLQGLLEDPKLQVDHPDGSRFWTISPGLTGTILATSRWGTVRRPAYDLAEALATQRTIRVEDWVEDPDGREHPVLNAEETAKALDKAAGITEAFAAWCWAEPARATAIHRAYNDRFNNLVLRSYDGVTLALPGLADWFRAKVHDHQHAGVARMVAEPSCLLAHEVGAGKTATMIMGTMELRRLGLITTAGIVVPNHVLDQFAREWLQLYPDARILVTTAEDLAGEKRRMLRARAVTGDWDAILIGQEGFKRIPVGLDTWTAYMRAEIARLAQLASKSNGLTVKRIEAAKARMERRVKERMEHAVDPGLTFEQLGIDYLVFDEAQAYKNLLTVSSIEGAAVAGSQLATDAHMKLWLLRRTRGRVVTFATATPIANSITEAYVMTRYLRPDLLEAAGVADFDPWAAAFAQAVSGVELAPQGGDSFQLKTRLARFRNMPELLHMFWTFADVKLEADLHLDVPLVAARPGDGRREAVIVPCPPTPDQEDYIADLGDRATSVRDRDPRKFPTGEVDAEGHPKYKADNLLWISTDGRHVALDGRTRGLRQDDPGKLAVAAANILRIWREHPRELQIVFCDLATPSADPARWTAYGELALLLEAGGMPRTRVAAIQQAAGPLGRPRLLTGCRNGHYTVIMGSTQTMGTGVNIQPHVIAMHHLDAPWRPDFLRQRNGRGFRPGNLNPEVQVYYYVTVGSFDGFMWQTLARKSAFIDALMSGRLDVREIDELSDGTLSALEIRAITTRNPVLLEHAAAEQKLTALQRSARAWAQDQARLAWAVTDYDTRIAAARERIAGLALLQDRAQDVTGGSFAMTVEGATHTDVPAAAAALARVLRRHVAALAADMQHHGLALTREGLPGGWLAGFPVTVALSGYMNHKDARIALALDGIDGSDVQVRSVDLAASTTAEWAVGQLCAAPSLLAGQISQQRAAIARYEHERGTALADIGRPFPRADDLAEAAAAAAELGERMTAMAAANQAADADRAAAARAAAWAAAERDQPAAAAA